MRVIQEAVGAKNVQNYQNWEMGYNRPGPAYWAALSKVLNINVAALYAGIDDDPAPLDPSADYLGVRRGTLKLSAGASGFAIEYENHDAPPIFFRREWFQKNAYKPDRMIVLRVQGHSMEPGLYDGDTVVVNLADTKATDGDVFAINYEGELLIKRLKRESGEWWICSDNQDRRRYPDKRCGDDVFIVGKIVYKQSERI